MAGIWDIRRVYCPMGCGETLHLMQSGMIMCLGKDCPNPGAAQQILGDRETQHIVVFREDGWEMIHPLSDRLGSLLACMVHEACNRLPGPPGGILGKYRVKLDGEGGLEVELLESAQPGPGTS